MYLLDESDFKSILNSMADGIITIDHRGNILSFNHTAEAMFGYKSNDVRGKNVKILMPEPMRSAHDSYIQNHLTSGVTKIIGIGREVAGLKKNGETFPMHLSVIEYQSNIEGERWFIGTCRDITLQKQQEEQLKRSLKMDAIGTLTSGLAHDYNNSLGVIMGFSELLSEKLKNDPDSLEYLKLIRQAAERASGLTQKLMSITRKRTDLAEPVIINDLLSSDRQILAKTMTPQIKLTIKCEDNLWPVNIDRGCLDDAILNLSINAKHAMPEGGELTLRTSNLDIDSLESQVLGITQGEYVKLSIADTGIGMPEDVISHIFEPFYSTKGEKGTGLGLSQVYNFVKESKGTIRVFSEPGVGTSFSIYLPRYQDGQAEAENDALLVDNKDEITCFASVLVVDDEKEITELVENILSSRGYKVFSASSVEEALDLLEKEKVELILSDVIMPGMDGFELAHIVRYTYPDIKVQLFSGCPDCKGKSVTDKNLAENILPKPFTTEKLLEKIQKLLTSRVH